MSKFTTGPWKMEEERYGGEYVITTSRDNWYIALAYGGTPGGSADARLITAAPDMFEALEAMLEQFHEGIVGIVHDERAAIMQAREALEKARGKS